MKALAKKYRSNEFVYDALLIGIVDRKSKSIYWHRRANLKYLLKTKFI